MCSPPRGLFHKTLQICKLWICSCGQILPVNSLVNCQNSVIYGHFAVNYEEKSFTYREPQTKNTKLEFKEQRNNVGIENCT